MDGKKSSPLARKLAAFVTLSEPELGRQHQRRRSFTEGRDLVHQGQPKQVAYILSAGCVCSYKTQLNGSRQIVDFQIPSDFMGLRAVGRFR